MGQLSAAGASPRYTEPGAAAAAGARRIVVLEQALWQPLLVRRLTFAVDSTCVYGEQQSPAGALLFYNAQTAP